MLLSVAHFLFLNTPLPQIEMIERNDDEGVANFFVGDEFRQVRHRHQSRHQILGMVPIHLCFNRQFSISTV